MLTALLVALIYICVAALVVYLLIWVLGIIGVSLPPPVMTIIWVIFTLVIILMLINVLLGGVPLPLRL